MTTAESISVAVGVANVALVVLLMLHLRRLGMRPPLPLVALMLFAIRAAARLIPPLGEEPGWFVPALDLALFVVLVGVLVMARRLVETFAHERDRLQRAQLDYDDALHRHESNVAELHRDALARLEAALRDLESSEGDATRDDALGSARAALATLRADGA